MISDLSRGTETVFSTKYDDDEQSLFRGTLANELKGVF